MAYKLPRSTNGHLWWDQLFAIYEELGSEEFLKWAKEAVRSKEGWVHAVKMMAWNDHNSEYNLDRNIALFRMNREGDRFTEEDIAAALGSMLEGMI